MKLRKIIWIHSFMFAQMKTIGDDINIPIVKFLSICSNILVAPAYSVYMCQLCICVKYVEL